MHILLALLGLVILVLAGDALVRGAVNVSLRLGIPALIVSLTIVAVGTSAPELLIAVSAVLGDAPGIAIGNVVGSNTANVLLVLGVPALLVGLNVANCDTRASYAQMMVGTILFIGVAFLAPIKWQHGLGLLGLYLVFMGYAIHSAIGQKRSKSDSKLDIETEETLMPWWKIGLYLLIGIVGLPLGADILVKSATVIARDFGISDTVIGLTLVAVGTSLPELATTISAAFRKQADVALGNVIGSNMANLLAIIGIASFFGSIPVDQEILKFDIWVMLAASLLLVPFVYFRVNINRLWGLGFVGLYVVYISSILI